MSGLEYPSTTMKRLLIPISVIAAASVALLLIAAPWAPKFTARPAVFEVTANVVNEDVRPFTVTVSPFGNNLNRVSPSGFEPIAHRTQITVDEASVDRIIPSAANDITEYDSWASGYLDGATVHIYRIENGKLNRVRTDTVKETVIAGWNYDLSKVIPLGVQEGYWKWDDWNRPGSTTWFTVLAVDKAGNVSKAGESVSLTRPEGKHKANVSQLNRTKPFRARHTPRDISAPSAPHNIEAVIRPDLSVKISWDSVQANDLAGYVIAKSDVAPEDHRGIYLELAGRPKEPRQELKPGDMVIVHHQYKAFDRKYRSHRIANLWHSNSEYYPANVPNEFYPGENETKNWRLVDHPADPTVTNPGLTYFEMKLGAGDVEKVGLSGIPDIGTTGQDFYPVPRDTEYIMEVWLKADRSDAPPVIFEYDGDKRVGGFLEPVAFQPETRWKKFTHTFQGRTGQVGQYAYFVLAMKGPATYSVDNYKIYQSDVPFLNFLPEQKANFRRSGMAAIRTHGAIKTGTSTYDMAAFTSAGGLPEGIPGGNSLPQELAAIKDMDGAPWLQIEFHMSPEEWLGFAEYMAAPYDPDKDTPEAKPWAAKRYRQGRREPWTDDFETIYFELANETWNGMFSPWTFRATTDAVTGEKVTRGEVLGMMHDFVVKTLRSSPYWTDEIDAKFQHVYGGWTIGSYNQEIAKAVKTPGFLTISAYNGGWDEGEGPPQTTPYSYFTVLNHPNVSAAHRARDHGTIAVEARKRGVALRLGTYEAGPGYAMNGLNNAKVTKEQKQMQEEVMKSKTAGVGTLDTFLTFAAMDFDLQNFFTFGEGDFWKSHAKWYRGGQAYPSFLALSLFNQLGTGDMLEVTPRSVSTFDFPKLRRRLETKNAPLAAVYASRKGDRVTLFCFNRQFAFAAEGMEDGHMPFAVVLPFNNAASITLHRMTGAPTDHNIDAERVKIESKAIDPAELNGKGQFSITPATGGSESGLPPAEVFVYVFEGTNIGAKGRTIPLPELLDRPIGFSSWASQN